MIQMRMFELQFHDNRDNICGIYSTIYKRRQQQCETTIIMYSPITHFTLIWSNYHELDNEVNEDIF